MAARRAYEVRLHPQAIIAYRRLRGPIADRISKAIDALAGDPRPKRAVELAGRGDFRIRVGDYRIVCAVGGSRRLVIVVRIAHPRDVYRP